MALYKGSQQIGSVLFGSTAMSRIYKGAALVFDAGAEGDPVLNAMFAGGETGDVWRFDAAHSEMASSSFLSTTGLVNALQMTRHPSGSPTLNTINGNECANFDGNGDVFLYDFGSEISQPGMIVISGDVFVSATAAVIVGSDGAGTTSRWGLNRHSTNYLQPLGGSTSFGGTRQFPIEKAVITIRYDGANSAVRINGIEFATGDLGSATTDYLTFGGWADGGSEWAGNLYGGAFINRDLDDEELDYLERLLGSYGGNEWPEGWWVNMFDGGMLTTNSNGWNGYTWRVRIPAASLDDIAGTLARIGLQAGSSESLTITKAYIGIEGATGFEFDSAPTQLTWDNGNTSVTIPALHTKMSDAVALALDGTEDVVISLYMNGGTGSDMFRYTTTMNGVQTQYKAATDDAATVGSISGYTPQNSANPIQRIVVDTDYAPGSGGGGGPPASSPTADSTAVTADSANFTADEE